MINAVTGEYTNRTIATAVTYGVKEQGPLISVITVIVSRRAIRR